jgi:site-specific recombinase XerD
MRDGVRLGDQTPYYPTNLMPIARTLADRRQQFNELREEFLLGYTYNTARAYWSDLEQIADWAEDRAKDVLALSQRDLKQYAALLRRRKYSEGTVRRRLLVYNLFRRLAGSESFDSATTDV